MFAEGTVGIDGVDRLRLFTGLRTLKQRLVLETVTVLRCRVQFGEAGCVGYGDVAIREGKRGGQADTLLTEWGNAAEVERTAYNAGFARADGFTPRRTYGRTIWATGWTISAASHAS